jgi:hypothetical protein
MEIRSSAGGLAIRICGAHERLRGPYGEQALDHPNPTMRRFFAKQGMGQRYRLA